MEILRKAKTREERIERIKNHIGTHVDFPKQGIVFRDIFPLFQNVEIFTDLTSVLTEAVKNKAPGATVIAGIEARGFLLGPLLAHQLGTAFVPLRKPGKLPGHTEKITYDLEYGTDTLEIPANAIPSHSKVVIVDDLMATGGTMQAAVKLIKQIGGSVVLTLCVIELTELKGKEKLNAPFVSIIQY